jgi:hypothetical protein
MSGAHTLRFAGVLGEQVLVELGGEALLVGLGGGEAGELEAEGVDLGRLGDGGRVAQVGDGAAESPAAWWRRASARRAQIACSSARAVFARELEGAGEQGVDALVLAGQLRAPARWPRGRSRGRRRRGGAALEEAEQRGACRRCRGRPPRRGRAGRRGRARPRGCGGGSARRRRSAGRSRGRGASRRRRRRATRARRGGSRRGRRPRGRAVSGLIASSGALEIRSNSST